MRYSIPVKFIAIALSALALVAGFASVLGIVQVAELGLYTDGFDGWVDNRLERQAYSLAEDLTERYAVRKLTNCSDEVLEQLGYWYVFEESIHWTGWDEDSYDFKIVDQTGSELISGNGISEDKTGIPYQISCSVQYPVLVTNEEAINTLYGEEFLHKKTVNIAAYNDKPVTVRYYESPNYTVTVTLDADAAMYRAGTSLALLRLIYEQRYNLMAVLAFSLVILSVGLVYLCCAAGRNQVGSRVNPRGLNRLPLDVYAAAGGVAGYLLFALAVEMINYWIFSMDNLNPGTLVLVGCVLLVVAVICIGFYFALCAQIKTKNLFWWKNSIVGWLCAKARIGIRFACKGIAALFEILPVIWNHLVIGGAMGIAVVAAALFATHGSVIPLLAVISVCVLIVLYGGYAYGTILQGAEKMAAGDLNNKIDSRFLIGVYKKCADYLNALADVAIVAARNQTRSERMKTELITNVSHDIKTPLTSIINYVDILQSAQTKEEAAQYLEVLGRQSQRLKKLIEDLMEMSKVNSGNMAVDIICMDPAETVNQALGEFFHKLEEKQLTVIFRQPESPLSMQADGRLTWRVLSNLLNNIVKYALPGTRVYVDVKQVENKVLLSLKNISKEALNVPADELTERFVRGDTSRNAEGSGLGLNIAKSLMELQKGQLQLLVDGDLFKVTLVFPAS